MWTCTRSHRPCLLLCSLWYFLLKDGSTRKGHTSQTAHSYTSIVLISLYCSISNNFFYFPATACSRIAWCSRLRRSHVCTTGPANPRSIPVFAVILRGSDLLHILVYKPYTLPYSLLNIEATVSRSALQHCTRKMSTTGQSMYRILNKMQSEKADFDPVPPPGKLDETYASSLIRVYSLHYVETWRRPQNRKYITYHNAVSGGSSHGHSNIRRKIGWNLDVWFIEIWICRSDRQTNKHTDTMIAILCTPTGAK